jgi:hypothetical protein
LGGWFGAARHGMLCASEIATKTTEAENDMMLQARNWKN